MGARVELKGVGVTVVDSDHRGSGAATRCAGKRAKEQPQYREQLQPRRELMRVALEGASVHYSAYARGYVALLCLLCLSLHVVCYAIEPRADVNGVQPLSCQRSLLPTPLPHSRNAAMQWRPQSNWNGSRSTTPLSA